MPVDNGLRDTGDLWRLTMEQSPVGMALLTPEGAFLAANRAFCDLLGYDAETITSQSFESSMHPDDLDSSLTSLRRMLAGEIDSFRGVKRWLRADGGTLVGDLSLAVLRDSVGAPIHVIVQVLDLTERRFLEGLLEATESSLQSERARAQAVFEAAHVGLLLVDTDGTIIAVNRRQQELMKLVFPEGHRGKAGQLGFVYDVDQTRRLALEDLPSVRAVAGEYYQNLTIWVGEEPESRRALSMTTRPVTLSSGAVAGIAVACLDVTDVLRASRAKEEFIAAISHELRTPLTSTLAYLELLEDGDGLSEDIKSQLGAVQRNAWRLARLVADLIYAARASSGTPLVVPHEVDLVLIFSEALAAATSEVAGKDVVVTRRVPETLTVMADGMRMRHMMDNVLAYAVASSSRQGRVDVELSSDDHRAVITVCHDQGDAELRYVTSVTDGSLVDADTSGRGLPGGLSLGVVRMIVEAHGGELSVQSAPGVGALVRVVLPR